MAAICAERHRGVELVRLQSWHTTVCRQVLRMQGGASAD
jgi:hypothetical protein